MAGRIRPSTLVCRDCCIVRPGLSLKAAALWQAYEKWAEENGERHVLNRKKFADRL